MGKPEKGESAVGHPSCFGMTQTWFGPVLMFKIIVLQAPCSRRDEAAESGSRTAVVPALPRPWARRHGADAATVWPVREDLV